MKVTEVLAQAAADRTLVVWDPFGEHVRTVERVSLYGDVLVIEVTNEGRKLQPKHLQNLKDELLALEELAAELEEEAHETKKRGQNGG